LGFLCSFISVSFSLSLLGMVVASLRYAERAEIRELGEEVVPQDAIEKARICELHALALEKKARKSELDGFPLIAQSFRDGAKEARRRGKKLI